MLAIMILLLAVLGCGQSKPVEVKSGRLKYVETLRYGSVGTHGSKGWYVSDRNFYVNNHYWSPDGINVDDDIANCLASPNEAVEALKCYSFADGKESAYVLRMNANKPEWVTASDIEYGGGDNLGEWIGDGHWLLFKDYYFNVQTSEQRTIKGLPDYPRKYFCAASPDFGTIIYKESCFTTRFDLLPDDKSREEKIKKQCEISAEHIKRDVIAFWLIDTASGNVKLLELKKENYPVLSRPNNRTQSDWLRDFQKMFIWEKDKNGKDQLVYPS